MKKIIFILSLITAGFITHAQRMDPINGFGFIWNRGEWTVFANMPSRPDTLFSSTDRLYLKPGSMFWHTTDTFSNGSPKLYVFHNNKWQPSQAVGSGGSTETLTNQGSGFRVVKEFSGNNYDLRTLFGSRYINIDTSSNTNGITYSLDTTDLFADMGADTLNDGDVDFTKTVGQIDNVVKKVQGIEYSTTDPTNNQVYRYNSTSGLMEPVTLSTGSGTNNSNIGSQFRWVIPHTQELRTAAPLWGQKIDSTTTSNALSFGPDTAYDKVSTRHADWNISHHNINAKPFFLQERSGVLNYADGATFVRLSNGKIFTVYGRTGTGNDFNNYEFYPATIDSLNKVERTGSPLFPGGTVSENSMLNACLFPLSNDSIGLLFQGYNSESDVTLYLTKSHNMGVTWTTPVAKFSEADFAHFFLFNFNRVERAPNGWYYLPLTVNTNDVSSTATGHYQGRYIYSPDGTSWALASTVFNSPDNACLEPAMFFMKEITRESYSTSNWMAIYCWRNRSGTIYYKDSVFSNSWSSTATAMGIDMGNDPFDIKHHEGKTIVGLNQYIFNAGSGQQQRSKLVLAISNYGLNDFKTVYTVYRDKTDTLTPYGPSLYLDSTNGNIIMGYTKIQNATSYGNLEIVRISNVFMNMGVQDSRPGSSTFDVWGGKNTIYGNFHQFNVYNKTQGFSPAGSQGFFSAGNGVTDQSGYIPQLMSRRSTGSGGAIWESIVRDFYTDPFSGGLAINVKTSYAGGAVTTSDLLSVLNNSSAKLRVRPQGQIVAGADSLNSPINMLWMDENGNIKKAASPSANTLQGVTDAGASTTNNIRIGSSGTADYPLHIDATTSGASGYGALLKVSNGAIGFAFPMGWPGATSGNKYRGFSLDGDGFHIASFPDALNAAPTPLVTFRSGGANYTGFNLTNPSGVLAARALGNTSSDVVLQILDNSSDYALKVTGDKVSTFYGLAKYNADYSPSADLDIPHIGKVNSLINSAIAFPYATYTLNADKAFSASSTAEVIPLDTEELESGIAHTGSSDEITFPTNGVYSISADIHAQSDAADVVKICIQKWDGDSWENVANSSTVLKLASASATYTASLNTSIGLVATDKIRFVASSTTTNVILNAVAAGDGVAAVPAFRVRISKIAPYNP